MQYLSRKGGFTLVELLVTIGIIAVLSAIVIVNVGGARERARDTKRVADMGQIQLALQLYKEVNGVYPDSGYDGVIGEGGDIDALLTPFMDSVPYDPLGPSNDDYQYYYDSSHECDGHASDPVAIVFARATENENNANYQTLLDTVCTGAGGLDSTGRDGGTQSYNIILGGSTN